MNPSPRETDGRLALEWSLYRTRGGRPSKTGHPHPRGMTRARIRKSVGRPTVPTDLQRRLVRRVDSGGDHFRSVAATCGTHAAIPLRAAGAGGRDSESAAGGGASADERGHRLENRQEVRGGPRMSVPRLSCPPWREAVNAAPGETLLRLGLALPRHRLTHASIRKAARGVISERRPARGGRVRWLARPEQKSVGTKQTLGRPTVPTVFHYALGTQPNEP